MSSGHLALRLTVSHSLVMQIFVFLHALVFCLGHRASSCGVVDVELYIGEKEISEYRSCRKSHYVLSGVPTKPAMIITPF